LWSFANGDSACVSRRHSRLWRAAAGRFGALRAQARQVGQTAIKRKLLERRTWQLGEWIRELIAEYLWRNDLRITASSQWSGHPVGG
jgi:hypothetical protein